MQLGKQPNPPLYEKDDPDQPADATGILCTGIPDLGLIIVALTR
jgi:hypothetical protein